MLLAASGTARILLSVLREERPVLLFVKASGAARWFRLNTGLIHVLLGTPAREGPLSDLSLFVGVLSICLAHGVAEDFFKFID